MGARNVRVAVGAGVFSLLAAAAAPAQIFSVLFSEDFEAPPGPAGTVGTYTEVDPLLGAPGPTLWHREGSCDSVPLGGYGATPSAVPFSSIAGVPGSVLVWGAGVNDFTSSTTPLPAPFSFFAAAKTTYRLNNNGWLTFGVPSSGFGTNAPIPTIGAPDDAIFAWWDDLVVRPGGFLRSLAVPGGDLVVEWNSEERFPGGVGNESASFQIVLHPSPANTIELRYDYAGFVASAANPWDATVGLENAAGTAGNDLTGLGTANSAFPAQDLLLTPLPPTVPTIPSSMGTAAAAYNRGDLGAYNYNTSPFANAGAIESPVVVSTSANTALYLLFDMTRQVDPGATTSFDQSFVEVAPAGSGLWSTLTQVTASPTCTGPAQRVVLLLPFALAGTSFQQRFRFDTGNANANGFRGWYVDNVRIDQVLAVTSPVFVENFDTGSVPGVSVGSMTEEAPATGFPTPTLWHDEANCDAATPLPAPLSGFAAAYHQGDLGNYTFNTGAANEGAIVSAVLPVPGGSTIFDLSFDYLKEGETGASFDQCFVDMRPTAAAPWSTAIQLIGNLTCGAAPGAFFLSATGGPFAPLASAGTGQFRLRFDTVDLVANSFLGWVVDNLAVTGRATAAALPTGAPCPGSGGCSPSISGFELPYAGNPAFQIRLNGGLPGAAAILVLGLSATGPPCFLALPFPIAAFLPGNACSLAVCPESILPGFVVSAGAACEGTTSLSVAIPPSTPPGATVLAQWFVIDATVFPSPATVAATQSLLLTVL
ncbi:MAG: hypothetical protein ACREIU_10460 [Planctomycetota bacterium]